ncbi:hypothetical protein [Clostridium disporicum]|uniref:hypothetical protein n=1 Tax=Clostridium disporicum TaxID=84024 RepID=UPI0034A4F615
MICVVLLFILSLFVIATFMAFEDEKFSIVVFAVAFIFSIALHFLSSDFEFVISMNLFSILSCIGIFSIVSSRSNKSRELIDENEWDDFEF